MPPPQVDCHKGTPNKDPPNCACNCFRGVHHGCCRQHPSIQTPNPHPNAATAAKDNDAKQVELKRDKDAADKRYAPGYDDQKILNKNRSRSEKGEIEEHEAQPTAMTTVKNPRHKLASVLKNLSTSLRDVFRRIETADPDPTHSVVSSLSPANHHHSTDPDSKHATPSSKTDEFPPPPSYTSATTSSDYKATSTTSSTPDATRLAENDIKIHEASGFQRAPISISTIGNSHIDRQKKENLQKPDFQSAHTLVPIHPAVQFHLSLDHLDCVRRQRQLGPRSPLTNIKELDCNVSITPWMIGEFYWSNEVYYMDGTFLQKQSIQCWRNERDQRPIQLTACPHQSLEISGHVFSHIKTSDTWGPKAKVELNIANQPPRCPSHAAETWNSLQGNYTQLTSCTKCHSYADCEIEMLGTLFSVTFTCYKNLGSGVKSDVKHPKWLPLLTGYVDGEINELKGDSLRQRSIHDLDKFAYVWIEAKGLSSRGLRDAIY